MRRRAIVVAIGAAAIAAFGRPAAAQRYTDVVPPSAETHRGFLTVHRIGARVLLEIPASRLGAGMLLLGGPDAAVVRWLRLGERIALQRVPAAGDLDSAYTAWADASGTERGTTLAVFPLAAEGADGAVVIDATSLALNEIEIFPAFGNCGASEVKRSFVVRAASYPGSTVIEASLTGRPRGSSAATTTRCTWTLAPLPGTPMRPRRFDERMGYFPAEQGGARYRRNDGVLNIGWETARANITRFRLERKDPRTGRGDPVTPIVFYLEPGIPARWHRWIRAGVEAWQPAFDAAGFTNAIVVRDIPPGDERRILDDVHSSIIRWEEQPNLQARAPGGGSMVPIIDGRTGEILKCDVVGVGSGTINLLQDWYYVQAAPLDPRARRRPYPDSLLGTLLQSAISHEIGHCLGLQDGSYGKLAYPVDSVRSPTWVRRMGHTPSIMNYTRNNYVAQPEDAIPPDDLVQHVGPADIYSIQWGYTPIPAAATADDERPTLERWIRVQDTIPAYRFVSIDDMGDGHPYGGDANDDADPIRSAGLGLANLRRVVALLAREAAPSGFERRDLENLHHQVMAQRFRELARVVDLVGGTTIQYKAGDQPGAVYTPVPAARQREAMRFLDSAAFVTPAWMIAPELTARYEAEGVTARLLGMQMRLLDRLLSVKRLHRLVQQRLAADRAADAYAPREMLADLRRSLWKELADRRVTIDYVRQGVQLGYLRSVGGALGRAPEAAPLPPLNPRDIVTITANYTGQEQALFRAELRTLLDAVIRAVPHAANPETRAHLERCRAVIDRALRDG